MKLADSGGTDRSPDSVATPEGDGEFDPAAPLTADVVEAGLEGLQTPRGSAPDSYEADTPSEMGNVIDEISRGKLLP